MFVLFLAIVILLASATIFIDDDFADLTRAIEAHCKCNYQKYKTITKKLFPVIATITSQEIESAKRAIAAYSQGVLTSSPKFLSEDTRVALMESLTVCSNPQRTHENILAAFLRIHEAIRTDASQTALMDEFLGVMTVSSVLNLTLQVCTSDENADEKIKQRLANAKKEDTGKMKIKTLNRIRPADDEHANPHVIKLGKKKAD